MKGEVYINGLDAYDRWGVNLEDGALSTLMTPAPAKDYIEQKSRLYHGKRVFGVYKSDSREIQLPFHITAKDKDQFFKYYEAFCEEVLKQGTFTLASRYQEDVVYRLIYKSCQQFRQFDGRMAVFTLRVEEPNPEDRKK